MNQRFLRFFACGATILALFAGTASAQSAAGKPAKIRVMLPERTLVLTHLITELKSNEVQKGDYVEFVVDRDIIENGYIVIRGGSRGSAQVTEAHAAGTSGKGGGIKLNFLFLYSTDFQQIPVDRFDSSEAPDRDTLPATAMGVVLTGGWGLFFHNFVHGSDAVIPTTAKGYLTVLGSHMIAVDPALDMAAPNSANAPAAPLDGGGAVSSR
jgi:hypothetical protein